MSNLITKLDSLTQGQVFVYFCLPIIVFAIAGAIVGIVHFFRSRNSKSQKYLISKDTISITFADVAGSYEVKEEMEEIADFLRFPQKFAAFGCRIPKGVLLSGRPGVGKTMLAKALAGSTNVPFFYSTGSDFVEKFVGVGALRIRTLFKEAKKNSPCIIFIDEIDAIGKSRSDGNSSEGKSEYESTLNQLLAEMDGFASNSGIIIIGATNRRDTLDSALLRPGRFDRHISVPMPDIKERKEILKIYLDKIRVKVAVDIDVMAQSTVGLAGADLANIINEAAIYAIRDDSAVVTQIHFDSALDRVSMGIARKNAVISDNEKKITAYHEAGHALVSCLIPGTDPVHKVSIVPRGEALGVTQQRPLEDRHGITREFALDRIAVLMGGRAAESIAFKSVTTGATNDIEVATEIAKRMVCEWGMNEALSPVCMKAPYSEQTAKDIDRQVYDIIVGQYSRAAKIIEDNNAALENLATTLLKNETIGGDEVRKIVGDK